jgi:hypothetical protein
MPAAPVVNKTLYNNHHQLSIIGSTQGQSQDLMRSQTQYNQSTGNVMHTPPVNNPPSKMMNTDYPEESLQGLL